MVEGQAGSDGEQAALQASIRLSPIATIVTDPKRPDNPIVAANEAFCALTGYPMDEVIGRNCRFLAGSETEAAAQRKLGEAIADARPVLVQLTNYRRDGTPFRNAVMMAPMCDEDGRLTYFVGSQMETKEADAGAGARALVAGLTDRQREVLGLLVRGQRNKQIAGALGIDEKTVKMHRARLLARLGAATSADAIRVGVEAGLQHGEGG